MSTSCDYCHFGVPLTSQHCPHCGQPGLFPNVRAAKQDDEQAALDQRYHSAVNEARSQGREAAVRRFEQALNGSCAVISRSYGEAFRLASSDRALYATFYQLTGLRLPAKSNVPDGPNWDELRAVIDTALFGDENKREIRFAALTLNGVGLANYGECSLILREAMIAHRASVFEENSILFMRHRDIRVWEVDRLPKGYRAIWEDRAKASIAKLAGQVQAAATPDQFAGILMREGATSADDDFVEVHIFGRVTIHTIETMTVTRSERQPSRARIKALEKKLQAAGITIQVRE